MIFIPRKSLALSLCILAALSALAQRLIAVKGSYASSLSDISSTGVQRFGDGSFADLYDYATQLSARIPDSQLRSLAANVQNTVQGVIISNDAASWRANAHGFSIYFPDKTVYARSGASSFYPLLQASKDTYWDDWLAAQPSGS